MSMPLGWFTFVPMPGEFKLTLPDRWITLAVFLCGFGLFVFSSGPGPVAYRDTGEMVVALKTLGVAHPPGYPLYVITGSLFNGWFLGNAALQAAYFSSLCGAAALALMYILLQQTTGRVAGLVCVGVLMVSNPFWELSAVPEMYAMGALFVTAILISVLVLRNPALFGLLFGLGLAVRLDMLLLAPVFAYPFLRHKKSLLLAGLFTMVGLSVFLYLPIRSLQQPILDWGDPETMKRLWNVVTRQSYGGSLDLLSQSYQRGENFISGMSLLGHHLLMNFGAVALAVGLYGLLTGWRKREPIWVIAVGGLVLSGPFFVFMANLPVNPHAAAIMEAAFETPMLFLILLVAIGIKNGRGIWRSGMASFIVISLALNVAHASPVAIRRHAWAAHDYFESVLRCAPGQSLVVFREDVQLFGLWEAQIVRNRRPDIQIIGAGLSSSAWYWDMMQRWPGGPAISLSFKTPAGFHQAIQQGRPFATGFETDVPDSLAQKMIPRGPLRLLGPEMSIWPSTMHDALIVRRISNNNQAHDFFSRDLLSDWAHSFHSEGVLVLNKDPERAERLFRLASRQDIDFPTALTDIAYMRLLKKDYVEAMDYYQQADETYQRLFEKTKVYRSLPAVVDSLNDGWAASLSHQGVTAERMGNIDRARDLYRKSLSIKPNPSAYFNLAVTYWDRDWAQAAQNFDQVLRLDPSHEQAAAYAQIARQRIKGAQ